MLVNSESIIGFDKERMHISNLKLEWKNKSILIVGAGATGISCAEFLTQNGIDFKIVDSREALTIKKNFVNVIYGEFQRHFFDEADVLIVSPGLSLMQPLLQQAIQQGKDVIGDVELFCRLTNKPIIAITGSNGKSTVTTLVGNILNALNLLVKIGGNIGVPCLELLKHDDEIDCYVLELSSFQLETTFSLKAHASAILNLSEDHLDRYSSYDDYCNAKKKILLNAENVIINRDDELVVEFSRNSVVKITSFSLSDPSADLHIKDNNKVFLGNQKILDLSKIKLIGQHNKSNILAALSLCSVFDIDLTKAQKVINNFSGLEHRSQVVSEHAAAMWINDSKATNIGATRAALKGLSDKPVYLILGGQAKGQDFNELVPVLTNNIKEIIVYGEDAGLITSKIENKIEMKISRVDILENAVKSINEKVALGDFVLFSPACASFDQFDNYMQRGDCFVAAVKGLEC